MKKIFLGFLLIVSLCGRVFSDILINTPCSLVYVHIGPKLPDYLSIAVSQARLFNPEVPIYLLAESVALNDFDYEKEKINLIPLESLTISDSHKRFNHYIRTKGFWRYALERFLYLDDFIQQYKLTNVFHTENDVMIYFDLLEKLPLFQEYYKGMIASVFDCDERSVPSFVYFSTPIPSFEFAKYISKKGLKGANDMYLLSDFKDLHYKTLADHLPILIPAYAKDHELKSLYKKTARSPAPYINNLDKFGLIFDAAAIGQFLGGIDPILGNRGPGFVGELSVFLSHLFTYEWQMDNNQRWIPYISYGGVKYPIANLHIHCKNLVLFSSLNSKFPTLPTKAYSSVPIN